MKKRLLSLVALGTAMAAASPAAAITFLFAAGAPSPSTGFNVVANFNDGSFSGFTTTGNVQVKTPPADGNGAPPANSSPSGTPYLSVLAGGTATYTFAQPVSAFQFDWGSVDSFNLVTIRIQGQANDTVVPGTDFITPANGNQAAPVTNGLFTVLGTSGELFTSITLSSSTNSFEIDNLAVGSVPEPATWGLLLLGFGMVGVGLRTRRKASVSFG